MIFLFTDFGAEGPYLGQVQAVLQQQAAGITAINLVSDAPAGDPELASYLLAALARQCPAGSVFLCVVDPGVGGERLPVVLEADGNWYVGPANGLLHTVAVQAEKAEWRIITWRPPQLSASFHGRDLFAPVAAAIARGDGHCTSTPWQGPNLEGWPADRAAVVYFDHYGNALTGCRYRSDLDGNELEIGDLRLRQAATFCRAAAGQAFWYRNSCDLVEIAVNQGRADRLGPLRLGAAFRFLAPLRD